MNVSVTQYIKSVIEIDCSFNWVIKTPRKLFKAMLNSPVSHISVEINRNSVKLLTKVSIADDYGSEVMKVLTSTAIS